MEIASQRNEEDGGGVELSICLCCVKCGNHLGYKRVYTLYIHLFLN